MELAYHGAAVALNGYYVQRSDQFFATLRSANVRTAFDYGAHWKYLTELNLRIGCLYYALAFMFDLVKLAFVSKGSKGFSSFQRFIDALSSSVFVFSTMVCAVFWIFMVIDPAGMIPPEVALLLPRDLNLHSHLTVGVLAWGELVFCNHHIKSITPHFLVLLGFAFSYIAWSYNTTLKNGYWPYPFQNDFTLLGHAQFDSFLLLVAYLLLHLARFISCVTHPNAATEKSAHNSKTAYSASSTGARKTSTRIKKT